MFASTAGTNQLAEFGSLAAGVPQRYSAATVTPALIQALSNYLAGWSSAVLGGNSPAIEDMNSICYLFSYQIAYLMQAGIAEWDSATTYYIGSLVNSGGAIYRSLTDNNLNNAVTSTTNWQLPGASNITSKTTTYAVVNTDNIIFCSGSSFTVTLPTAVGIPGVKFIVKKTDTSLTNLITIATTSSQTIDGSTTYVINLQYESITVVSDGANWSIL